MVHDGVPLGGACIFNQSCALGFCLVDTCAKPELHTPCNPLVEGVCPVGSYCNSVTRFCVSHDERESREDCGYNFECEWGYYCKHKRCTPRLGLGESCSFTSGCKWGLTCSKGTCQSKCLLNRDCPPNSSCIKDTDSVLGGRICSSNSRPKPKLKPNPNPNPNPNPPNFKPRPITSPQNQPSSSSPSNYLPDRLRNLSGNMAFYIGTGIIFLIVLIIIIIFTIIIARKKFKRRGPASNLGDGSHQFPPTPAVTIPNFSYTPQEMVQPIIPPPSYDQVVNPGQHHCNPATTSSPTSEYYSDKERS